VATSKAAKGFADLRSKLRHMAKSAPQEAGRALYQEALVEQKEAMRRCPIDTGALRASHETTRPAIKDGDISVAIRCGGPSAPYALIVHEDLEADHPVGEAKWLERTLRESAPHMGARIAKRFDANRLLGK
jgi:hypothetical protein